jgi:YD repeat-containing protein
MMTRTTQLIGLTVAIASLSGCELLLGPQRSTARVSEMESSSRYEGSTSTITRAEYEYRKDGLIDEITVTSDGDFVRRTELSWNDSDQLEEVTVLGDNSTLIYELEWDRDLLTEVRAFSPDEDGVVRIEVSYFNGDARFLEKVVTTAETDNNYGETRVSYGYDETSRVGSIKTTNYSEYDSGFGSPTTSESKSDADMRYDSDTGRLERVTLVTEIPLGVSDPISPPPTEEDVCETYGWYGDGTCDTNCLYPDPDCGPVDEPEPVQPDPEFDRDTQLWSMSYDEDGRLDEVLAPSGRLTSLDYDRDDGRLEEIETMDDGYTTRVEYQYEEGTTKSYSFSPAVDYGGFFDVEGESFGTLQILNSLGF